MNHFHENDIDSPELREYRKMRIKSIQTAEGWEFSREVNGFVTFVNEEGNWQEAAIGLIEDQGRLIFRSYAKTEVAQDEYEMDFLKESGDFETCFNALREHIEADVNE